MTEQIKIILAQVELASYCFYFLYIPVKVPKAGIIGVGGVATS
jgi:hypothetical protein